MIGSLATSAQFENDLRADRVRETIAYRKANGLVSCAHVPLGKRLARDEHRKKTWVRDDRQCIILEGIYILRHDRGMSCGAIAGLLHRRGIVGSRTANLGRGRASLSPGHGTRPKRLPRHTATSSGSWRKRGSFPSSSSLAPDAFDLSPVGPGGHRPDPYPGNR